MIAGIGTDLVSVDRIRRAIARHHDVFLAQVFTEEERRQGEARANGSEYFAGRWAVKEAVAKALGCGIGAHCRWQEIETGSDDLGRPGVTLRGEAAATAAGLGVTRIHVSVSHERDFATATVILES